MVKTDGHRAWIKKFTSMGTYLTEWGSVGTAPGEFTSPFGVCVDGSLIYVVDTYNNRIQKFAYRPVALNPESWGRIKGQYR